MPAQLIRPDYDPATEIFVVDKPFTFDGTTYGRGEFFGRSSAGASNRKVRMLYEQRFLEYMRDDQTPPEPKPVVEALMFNGHEAVGVAVPS